MTDTTDDKLLKQAVMQDVEKASAAIAKAEGGAE